MLGQLSRTPLIVYIIIIIIITNPYITVLEFGVETHNKTLIQTNWERTV